MRPARPDSYERAFRDTGLARSLTDLREATTPRPAPTAARIRAWSARSASSTGRRPSSRATISTPSLAEQFDAFVWFEETRAVTPLPTDAARTALPETYPFGL